MDRCGQPGRSSAGYSSDRATVWGSTRSTENKKYFKNVFHCLINYHKKFGSGALSGKMLLVRLLKIIKLILILGHVRLSKGYPAGLGKGLG